MHSDIEIKTTEQFNFFPVSSSFDDEHDKKAAEFTLKLKQDQAKKRFFNSGIFGKMLDYNFDNYSRASEKQKILLQSCKNLIAQIANNKYMWICFLGSYGIGKTHLSVSMIRYMCSKIKCFHNGDENLPIYWNSFYGISGDFCKEYHHRGSYSSRKTQLEYIEELSKVDFLVIDEIGRNEKLSDEKEFLFRLLDSRYNLRKSTVLISNMNEQEFTNFLGGAILDRLNSCGVYLDTSGIQSFRQFENS